MNLARFKPAQMIVKFRVAVLPQRRVYRSPSTWDPFLPYIKTSQTTRPRSEPTLPD